MSETTPESGPNANVSEPEATTERAVAAEPSVAEPTSSEPEAAAAQDAQAEPAAVPATEAPAAPAPAPAPAPASAGAEPQDDENDVANPPSEPVSARGHVNRPAKTIEPEPVVASHDDVAAAVARSTDEPGASAGGSATVDTASPVQSATPVIVAAEAAKLQQDAEARQSGAATAPERTQAQPTAAQPTADQRPADQQPAAVPAGAYAAGAASPIFIQRPTPPKRKSNRGFGILLALVGTVVFAALWVLAVVVVGYLLTPNGEFADALTRFFLGQIAGWVPVVAFFIGMVVLIQVLNRARWWAYILGGLFVALFVYFAYVGASLVDLHVWTLNGNEASVVLQRLWVAPFAVLAGVIAREISVWTGAWLAARGRKLKARNAEAQADYEQQLADAQNQAVAAYAQPQGY